MNTRTSGAVAVLLLWAGGVGVLVWKEYFRPQYDQLAIAALRVNPGAVYFAIYQDSVQSGFASSVVDTSNTAITETDNMVLDPATTGPSQRSVTRSKVVLSRGLRVRGFELSAEAQGPPVHTVGTVDDTSLVVVRTVSGTRPDTTRFPLTGPVFLPTLLPLVLPLTQPLKVGVRYPIPLFDPMSFVLGNGTYSVAAESLFVLSDSAAFDTTAKRWKTVSTDTVRAWRITPVSGPIFSGWIDAQGQLVQTTRMGVELNRFPYEVAFNNWKAESDKRDAARIKR